MQVRGDFLGVFPSGFIFVRYHCHGRAVKVFGEVRLPLSRAAWVACRRESSANEGETIFFAFGDIDRPAIGYGLNQFREHKRNAADAGCFPKPSAFAVRFPLAKIFWLVAANLKKQFAVLGAVVVFGDDATADSS